VNGCLKFGFDGGTLSCNGPNAAESDRCQFNTSACRMNNPNPIGLCGGTTLDKGEQCEPEMKPYNVTCLDFNGFTGGDIACTECRYDLTNCAGPQPKAVCGNSIVEPGEMCEGSEERDCSKLQWI